MNKLNVEMDTHDPTLLYINGEKYCVKRIKTKKIDKVTHVERAFFGKLDENEYNSDLKLIVDTLKDKTSSTELLTEMLKEISPRLLKRIATRIKGKKVIKKHNGCLGFKIGDCYIQLLGGYNEDI